MRPLPSASGEGVTHLLDLSRITEHTFAFEDGDDLVKGQSVVLDGQRSLDGSDTIIAAQVRRKVRSGSITSPIQRDRAPSLSYLPFNEHHLMGLVETRPLHRLQLPVQYACRYGSAAGLILSVQLRL